jgi:hypothetical protein
MSQDLSNIQKYLSDIDLLNQTAAQIIKDFEMFGLEVKFSGNRSNAYEELFEQIQPHIEKLLNKDHSRFMSIMYRVDISETQLKKKLIENTSESTSEIITELIIKRELQKVVIRNYYKKND